MIRKLVYYPPSTTTPGYVQPVPAKEDEAEKARVKYREKPIPGAPGHFDVIPTKKPVAHWEQERYTLRVYAKDAAEAHAALMWFIGDANLPLGAPPHHNDPDAILSWSIPGHFVPDLAPDDIHRIVEDYWLLAGRYGSFSTFW